VSTRRPTLVLYTLAALVPVFGADLLRPAAAEAQGRGSVQVYAQVVDTKAGSEALQLARTAVRDFAASGHVRHDAVSTVAQITVARRPEEPTALIVTIDYSTN